MTNIRKAYEEIYEILETNKNKKVSTILPQLIELMKSKGSSVKSTLRYDDEGNLTHVFCYYHKEWEDISEVEYGKKAGTKSGLNTMCKQGVSNWTKQQREAKKAKEELLTYVANGDVDQEEMQATLAEIEAKRAEIVPYETN